MRDDLEHVMAGPRPRCQWPCIKILSDPSTCANLSQEPSKGRLRQGHWAEMLQGGFQRRGAGAPEAGTDNIHHGVLPEFPSADQRVAVGTALTGGPPHRSQRAELPHWAPASGSGSEAHFREGMLHAGGW